MVCFTVIHSWPRHFSRQCIGADDLFHGRAFTGPLGQAIANPALGYDGAAQRYDPLSPVFSNQNTALALSPLLAQTLPVAKNLQYDSALQATFGIERQLAPNLTLAVDYNYAHGAHLLRPRNINQGNYDLIVAYERALAVCPNLPGVSTNGCVNPIYGGPGGPLSGVWDALGGSLATSLAPLGQLIFNQFRGTGPNYTWANSVSQGAPATANLRWRPDFKYPRTGRGTDDSLSIVKIAQRSGRSMDLAVVGRPKAFHVSAHAI